MLSASIQTQFGLLLVSEDEGAICALRWADAPATDTSPLLTETLAQLAAYDAGTLETFDVPLRVKGSDFQRAVCDLMFAIPFGETVTYGDIAKALTVPAQAVGQACGGNPIPGLTAVVTDQDGSEFITSISVTA